MAEQKYIDFLNKLIEKTKAKEIDWRYLDTNKVLYEEMGWTKTVRDFVSIVTHEEKEFPNFNREDSFYTKKGDTFIVIYVWENHPAELFVIPITYKKVVTLVPDLYGEYITRLLNLVQSQFPNAEAFIDNFLED